MKDYHINIFHSERDDCYTADIPDLKYCSACGETAAQALQELQIAKAAWLATARIKRKRIPKPTDRPVSYQAVR